MSDPIWKTIARNYDRLIDICGLSTAAAVVFLTFGITLNVAIRALGVGSIDWMLEASEYALLVLTFLGAPWALRQGAHVHVDVVLNFLPRWAARSCEIASDLLGAGVSLVLLIWGIETALTSAASHSMIYKVLIFPEWWLYALIALSGLLLSIEFMRRLARAGSGETMPAPPAEML
jgi:TRAP-type C4-dicarboxylate transport system permease small subunit